MMLVGEMAGMTCPCLLVSPGVEVGVGVGVGVCVLVKNPPPAPGSLFLGVAIRSALGRDLTRVPKQISISGKPTSRLAIRHFKKTCPAISISGYQNGGSN